MCHELHKHYMMRYSYSRMGTFNISAVDQDIIIKGHKLASTQERGGGGSEHVQNFECIILSQNIKKRCQNSQ